MATKVDLPARWLYDRTGLRVDLYTARFALEDGKARIANVRDPAARREEQEEAAAAATSADWVAFSRRHFGVGPVQITEEIAALIDLLQERGVRVACEIGAHDAGSSVLFLRAVPTVQTLFVMDLYVKNRWRLRRLARPGQRVHAIDGDTTHPRTVERLRRQLGGRLLDFILIDGDHGYAGVRSDFLTYRHFVRPGGLIAFHDIVPVSDPASGRWAGDVPAFWSEVRELYEHREFVASPDQDGLGIGVVAFDPAVSVASIADR